MTGFPSPPSQNSHGFPEKLTSLVYDDQHTCFGCGALNPSGLHLRFYANASLEAVCHLTLDERFQGPHGYAHGGVIAAMLDEVMSKAIHANPHADGQMCMTRHMETDFRRPVPLGAPLALRGRQVRVEGRKHFCEAMLTDADGRLLAGGKALFIAIARGPEHKH